MKTSECAYCGNVGFTINDACLNCSLTLNPGDEPTAQTHAQNDLPPAPDNNLPEPPAPDFLQSAPQTLENEEPQPAEPASNDTPYRHTEKLKYTRVECWKCKMVFNWEKTKICTQCGCALRYYKKEEIRSLKGDSFLGSSAARSFLMVVFVFAMLVGGFYYVIKNMDAAKTKAAAGITEENIALPANGWYKSNLWNLYRELPTVDEILAKNAQATSKTLTVNNIQTLSLKGTISFADGNCVTDACAEKLAEAAMRRDQMEMSRFNGYQPQIIPKDGYKIPLLDDYDTPEYEEAGTLENHRKAPDKILRKISVVVPKQTRKLETTEGFDGMTGWKKQYVSENGFTVTDRVSTLAGLELESLKSSVSALKSDYSSKSVKFSKVKKVKTEVNFVLENPGFEKTELIYFDAVSGLISKIESGDNTCYMVSYADYGELKLPSAMYFRTVAETGFVVWMKVENIVWTINEPLDDSMFAKP